MRVHGDKIIKRRDNIAGLSHYSDARKMLEEDFQYLCGYCGKNGKTMHQKFHIDHFVPKSLDPNREKDYYNLVLACPKCNLLKSDKWPTKNKDIPNDGEKGFVDPASEQFDQHVERNEQGYVVGITPLGKDMCSTLHLNVRRTDLYWKIDKLRNLQDQLDILFLNGKIHLDGKEAAFYIKINILLKYYIDQAFDKGE